MLDYQDICLRLPSPIINAGHLFIMLGFTMFLTTKSKQLWTLNLCEI
jgi:hypothetical protein